MLCFLPPIPATPRRDDPEPRRGTAVGVVLAIILSVAGLLLPWLRSQVNQTAFDDPPPRPAPIGDRR